MLSEGKAEADAGRKYQRRRSLIDNERWTLEQKPISQAHTQRRRSSWRSPAG